MIQVKKMESQDHLTKLKKQYVQQTTAPLDGMWLGGFVPMANHFGCYEGDELVGFFCVNDEGYLLQFLVNQNCQSQSSQLFETVLHGDDLPSGNIKGAFVSTAEPYLLSLCLDCFSKFDVNALMYQLDGGIRAKSQEHALSMTTVDSSQLPERKAQHLYVDGGKTIQAFLEAGEIQRLIITKIPVLLGDGIPLFGPLPQDIQLKHIETRTLQNGNVQSEYEVA